MSEVKILLFSLTSSVKGLLSFTFVLEIPLCCLIFLSVSTQQYFSKVFQAAVPRDVSSCTFEPSLDPISFAVDVFSASRNGKHCIKPAPDSVLTLRPPIKERAGPESTASEANKTGRPFCTAEEVRKNNFSVITKLCLTAQWVVINEVEGMLR